MPGGWPDEDTTAAHTWLAAYLRDLGITDADDHAMAILIEMRGQGWRCTAARRATPWQRPARPAGADTARETAEQIRADLGWLPTDSSGDDE